MSNFEKGLSQVGITDSDLDQIPGWFFPLDRFLFRFMLDESRRQCGVGDTAEIGCYFGKSAVLIGKHCRDGETMTVVDLFEDPSGDPSNAKEISQEYRGLTEAQFISNYSKFNSSPPKILRMDSALARRELTGGRHRFFHIDGSHLYSKVIADIDTAKLALAPQGVVVLDDFRSEHTPGVAAAAWEAVAEGLRVVALSPMKLYGTWGDPDQWRSSLQNWVEEKGIDYELQDIRNDTIIRLLGRA